MPNVVLHDNGPYIISNATFSSYFLKDEAAVIDGHARLDALLGRWKSSDGTQCREVRARFAGRVLYETAALGVRRNDPLIAYGTA